MSDGSSKLGSLYVVGSGISAIGQMTIESKNVIANADVVLYLLTDPLTEAWIQELNPSSRSMHDCYHVGESRLYAYGRMINEMLSEVRMGKRVCAVFYGHPGVFVDPGHKAVRLARNEGYRAMMLPGVSAEDCLSADLGFDPAARGCQMYEATDFMLRRRTPSVHSPLILWQVGVVGCLDYQHIGYDTSGWHLLLDYLIDFYGESHQVTLYEAATLPLLDPVVETFALSDKSIEATSVSTLLVPQLAMAPVDPEMARALGIDIKQAHADATKAEHVDA